MRQISNLRELASRAYYGNYTDHERVADNFVVSYTKDLNDLLSKIPADYHGWVTEKYISLLTNWLNSMTSTYSAFISGASNYPSARMQKLNGWADNHYKKFSEWRENIIIRVNRWEKKKNYSLSSEIEEQREKLSGLQEWQETMKQINKIVRDKKRSEEDISDELSNFGISGKTAHKLLNPDYSYQKKGFQSWQLSNNNACIRNTQNRIAELEKRLEAEGQENESYTINGVTVEKDIAANRIKLFFPSKPDEKMRTALKSIGFRWSPNNECWQAYPSAEWKIKDLLTNYSV